ncbi:UPF0598 protein CG30010 [Halyomorpha halys]|uniref:UPF0598 protein CG30010 n=1 Tax=Halyomorpha halys TaxID=286706 RepID=UPI0006D51421|nr:UPF0598 protein CG30010 [Halyomorpha halys]
MKYHFLIPFISASSKSIHLFTRASFSKVSYIQGQSPRKNIREYFYYIDHQGMLFLDDARMKNFTSCFKDKDFLVFFYKRIRLNNTSRYESSFPYVSLCGRERNYIRCDDVPIVYTHIVNNGDKDLFCYGNAGDLMYNNFLPEKLFMDPETGRMYHPCHETAGSIGLVASKLAIQLSKLLKFDNGEDKPPTHFYWKDILYSLDTGWYFLEKQLITKKS